MSRAEPGIQIVTVCGTARSGNYTAKALALVNDEQGRCLDERIEKRIRGVATDLLDYIGRAVCPRIALEAMVREEQELEWA